MDEKIAQKKAQRLSRMAYLLYRNPAGMTSGDLAQLCGVSQRTIQRDLADLEGMKVPLTEVGGSPPRYTIVDGYYLPPIHLTLDDAVAFYLAARLLARYADSSDPYIVDALAKLATILPEAISRHVQATAASVARQESDDAFVGVMSVLALGWASGRKVRIWYRSYGSDNVHDYLLCPYFLEPAAFGASTHVIGHASFFEEVRTFKVERIQKATLTEETYEIPEDFDGPGLLSSAWGVWFGEEIKEVALRFCPEATRRVKETRWHPSQEVDDLEDGGCILRLRLAHPEEMLYWIRGWGPQVEVLEPEEIRQQVAREAAQMVAMYGERSG